MKGGRRFEGREGKDLKGGKEQVLMDWGRRFEKREGEE